MHEVRLTGYSRTEHPGSDHITHSSLQETKAYVSTSLLGTLVLVLPYMVTLPS